MNLSSKKTTIDDETVYICLCSFIKLTERQNGMCHNTVCR